MPNTITIIDDTYHLRAPTGQHVSLTVTDLRFLLERVADHADVVDLGELITVLEDGLPAPRQEVTNPLDEADLVTDAPLSDDSWAMPGDRPVTVATTRPTGARSLRAIVDPPPIIVGVDGEPMSLADLQQAAAEAAVTVDDGVMLDELNNSRARQAVVELTPEELERRPAAAGGPAGQMMADLAEAARGRGVTLEELTSRVDPVEDRRREVPAEVDPVAQLVAGMEQAGSILLSAAAGFRQPR